MKQWFLWSARAACVLGAAIALLVAVPVAAAKAVKTGDDTSRNKKAFFDIRQTPSSLLELHGRAAALDNNPPTATAALKDPLGVQGFGDLGPLPAMVRCAGRSDGFRTSASSPSASS